MKKILLLLFIPFFLSGCYDYNELNDLAIITGVAIDYDNNSYQVTFEILSTKKNGETSGATSAYTVSASGKTITEAFLNNGNIMDKVPYYDHVDIVLISEDIAKDHFADVAEFIIRGSQFRNEVFLCVAKDTSASSILKTTSEEKPVATTFLTDLLEHSNDASSSAYYTPFTKTLNSILTPGEDALAPVFTLKSSNITLDGLALFQDFTLKTILNTDDASLINLLKNFNATTIRFEHHCNTHNKTVITIYDASLTIDPNHKDVLVKGTLNARIQEDSCNYDLKAEQTYTDLEQIFTKVITNRLTNVINITKEAQSNVLNIGKLYYNKYRENNPYLWTTQNFNFDLNLKINKKGLVFKVPNEK